MVRLKATMTFRQWVDALDAGRLPAMRAWLDHLAPRLWRELPPGGIEDLLLFGTAITRITADGCPERVPYDAF